MMQEETYPFVVRPLPYEYNALAPVLDAQTLTLHHDRHYKTYVDRLNATLADYPELQQLSLYEILTRLDHMPRAIQTALRNNGGGVYNHELYFDSMHSPDDSMPQGALAEAIKEDFGTYKQWQEKMRQTALDVFGSGWAWLLSDRDGRLSIQYTANQNVPELTLYTPILLTDVWEHAYYPGYQNRRGDYLDGWFSLIHWRKAERRYEGRSQGVW